MGSFDVGCAVSGLTIGYQDEAYIVPLLPENMQISVFENKFDFTFHTQHDRGRPYAEGFHTYSDTLFQPFLPIRGDYNTYGTLECIEENSYTRFLESMFGISIEDIVRIITSSCKYDDRRRREIFEGAKGVTDKTKNGYDFLKHVSAMFVHADIYDHMSRKGKPPREWGWGDKYTVSEAYDRLHAAIVKYDTPPENETEDECQERRLNSFWSDPMRGERYPEDRSQLHIGHLLSHKWYSFRAVLREFVKRNKLKAEICEFLEFDSTFQVCNRLYSPGISAGQGDDNSDNMELYLAALRVIGKNTKRLSDENVTEKTICKWCGKRRTKYLEDACRKCHLKYCGW
jgi:hypothetical protein